MVWSKLENLLFPKMEPAGLEKWNFHQNKLRYVPAGKGFMFLGRTRKIIPDYTASYSYLVQVSLELWRGM
jgi:hypothetical protein